MKNLFCRQVLLLEAGGEQPTKSRIPWFSLWLAGQHIATNNIYSLWADRVKFHLKSYRQISFIQYLICTKYAD